MGARVGAPLGTRDRHGSPVKVSIVTICFNQAALLEQAIRSVLDQDYADIEYIVVDPGSTDGSREIIAHYCDRIAAIIDQPDERPAGGLNKGFARATTSAATSTPTTPILPPRSAGRSRRFARRQR